MKALVSPDQHKLLIMFLKRVKMRLIYQDVPGKATALRGNSSWSRKRNALAIVLRVVIKEGTHIHSLAPFHEACEDCIWSDITLETYRYLFWRLKIHFKHTALPQKEEKNILIKQTRFHFGVS